MSSNDGILLFRLSSPLSSITVGNGQSIPILSRGTSLLQIVDRPFHLDTVLVAPQLTRNGATLPNRVAYRSNPEKTKEIQRQVQDLLDRGYVRESLSPCAIPVILVQKKMVVGVCVWIVEQLTTSR
jgi:hypothetical protein